VSIPRRRVSSRVVDRRYRSRPEPNQSRLRRFQAQRLRKKRALLDEYGAGPDCSIAILLRDHACFRDGSSTCSPTVPFPNRGAPLPLVFFSSSRCGASCASSRTASEIAPCAKPSSVFSWQSWIRRPCGSRSYEYSASSHCAMTGATSSQLE